MACYSYSFNRAETDRYRLGIHRGSNVVILYFCNSTLSWRSYGPGQTWLGANTVTTDANGNAPFNFTFNVTVPASQIIAATATDSGGSTSEFSAFLTMPTPSTTPEGGSLTNTGQSIILVAAAALLLVGFSVVVSLHVWPVRQ